MSSSVRHIVYAPYTVIMLCVCVCAGSFFPQGYSSPKVTWVWGPSWAQLSSTSSASSACAASSPARYDVMAELNPALTRWPFRRVQPTATVSPLNIQPHKHKVVESTHAYMHMLMQKNAGHRNTLGIYACVSPRV